MFICEDDIVEMWLEQNLIVCALPCGGKSRRLLLLTRERKRVLQDVAVRGIWLENVALL